jgi:hypothetical protein
MQIIIDRGKVVELETLPEYSIALDGFVSGPKIDIDHHRFSFDHHAGCLRYCTTAACLQALTAIQLGLDPAPYTIYANDVDVDVCMAIWCLKNADRCSEPLVEKLVNAISLGDMHAGAISCNGMTKTVEWISAPETDSKRYNDYFKISNDGLNSILEAILHRIDLYVDGEASIEIVKQQKHGEYKVLRNENGWALIETHDPHAFGSIYQAGFERIALVRPQTDNSLAITLAKKSDFVDNFPINEMYNELNKLEPGWGGSSVIGGAPRNADGSRSKLPMEKIIEIIDSVVKLSLAE